MTSEETGWFEALYESSYRRLTLIVLASTRATLPDAQEIVQEAFATAYARHGTVAAADNPEAWVCTVALNIAHRRWRRRSIAERLSRRDRPPPAPDLAEVGAAHADLYSAIRGLPDGQREAVFLHHLADLSVEQIAERTGVPTGTVKSRLARGRAALSEQLAPPPPLPPPHARSATSPATAEGTASI